LPLTQPDKAKKQELIEDTVNLAKQLSDEKQQLFAVAGILTATDKFIDKDYSNQIKEWIKMTKVARLFEEEKIEAVNIARAEARTEGRVEGRIEGRTEGRTEGRAEGHYEMQVKMAQSLLKDGEDYLKVMRYTELSRDEINRIQLTLGA